MNCAQRKSFEIKSLHYKERDKTVRGQFELPFYVTFGQRYRREAHPTDKRIHPDGVVAIKASTMEEAREQAFSVFGRNWSCIYTRADMAACMFGKDHPNLFIRGVVGEIVKTPTSINYNHFE